MLESEVKFGETNVLADLIESEEHRVSFKNIFSNANGGVSLIAFKAGQKLDEHVAPAELMVCTLEGEIIFSIAGQPKRLRAGEFLLLGLGVAHSVQAVADSKIMLVKIKA